MFVTFLSLIDRPEAPTISLAPQYDVYIPGETVTLRCEAPRTSSVTGYQFYKGGSEVPGLGDAASNHHTMSIPDKEKRVSFSCAYWIQKSGRGIRSPRSDPVSLIVTDRPEAPTISLSPQYDEYIPGETVTVSCEAPRTSNVTGYQFYKGGSEVTGLGDAASYQHTISIADKGKRVSFSCAYWIRGSGRGIGSPRSGPVSLSVADPSRPPTISLRPQYDEYIPGEKVTVWCNPPRTSRISRVIFYKDGVEVTGTQGTYSYWYTIDAIHKRDAGSYSCQYWIREISSPLSTSVSLRVTDPLSSPTLSLHPPDGRVSEGGDLTMNCTVPMRNEKVTVHFYKGEEALYSEVLEPPGGEVSFSIRIGQRNISDAGNYSCSYEAEIRGRRLSSPQSPPIPVSLKAARSPWVWIGAGAGLALVFLLVLVLLLFWILVCKKGKSRSLRQKGDDPSKRTDAMTSTPHRPPEEDRITYASLVHSSSESHQQSCPAAPENQTLYAAVKV
ncbi:Fc receptor-like protein 5 isoform X2 [Rhinatrema bivittatum]|uniref:Fc receptor-like protein 5 isoform X2 n=1 Tax=Rhinatrema bivittatum TaxID=194408 RepID=UPI001126ABAC|nr:Fc receptor-like protein 5 isoform X2 [Rhinatrema bivittatum]